MKTVRWSGYKCFSWLILVLSITGCSDYEVEVVKPIRGRIEVSFTEPAATRLENKYLITMPVAGRIGRVQLIPGYQVSKGLLLVDFDTLPLQQSLVEAQAYWQQLKAGARPEEIAQAEAAVEGAQALVDQLESGAREQEKEAAQTAFERAQVEAEYAQKEFERLQGLLKQGATTDQLFQAASSAYKSSQAKLKEAEAQLNLILEGPREEEKRRARTALKQAQAQLELTKKGPREEEITRAEAQVTCARHNLELADIRSPIDGIVLEKYEDGDRTLPAGQPLLLLGSLKELEVEAEVLSQDALRLRVGGAVLLELGGDRKPLVGEVKRIEPAGFTKLSSLGVEQQRVKVMVSFAEEIPKDLGVDYRIHARFITGAKQDALLAPRFSVLQDADGSFYVMRLKGGKLEKVAVKLGLRNDLQIEITEGLSENDTIVKTPDTTMKDGQKVKVQN
ncbi:MAG: hypothetical protein AMJ79_01660 [Phycisphaerae bacterium SM23_30]|nr:MAG: hypothetical protein AMJ79_01660 [Phycisphaerae bacterium SM23_30]